MKINFNNTYYPKPLLSSLIDDFNDNKFEVQLINQVYDKVNQKLELDIKVDISNKNILKLIENHKIAVILHLEQKTQRELSQLKCNDITKKVIDLYHYSTSEPIEVIAILYCRENFEICDNTCFNNIVSHSYYSTLTKGYLALNSSYFLLNSIFSIERILFISSCFSTAPSFICKMEVAIFEQWSEIRSKSLNNSETIKSSSIVQIPSCNRFI